MKVLLNNIDGDLVVLIKDIPYEYKDLMRSMGWRWDKKLKGFATFCKAHIKELLEEELLPEEEENLLQQVMHLFGNFRVVLAGDKFMINGDTYRYKDLFKTCYIKFDWESKSYQLTVNDFLTNRDFIRKNIPEELYVKISVLVPKNEEKAFSLTPSDNITLYKHQVDGVKFIHDKQMVLLNWSMGSGKTFAPIAYAHSENLRLFAVVPALTRLNFFRECVRYGMTAGIYPKVPTMKKKYREFYEKTSWEDAQAAVTSYATLNQYKKKMAKKGVDVLDDIVNRFDMLVLDESQYIKNYKAQRTKTLLTLIQKFKEAGKKVVFLSGTPLTSRPAELYTTLKSINDGLEGFKTFAKRYNGAFETQWGLQMGRATNVEELHERMKSFTSRVRKEDVLELPEKIRSRIIVPAKKFRRPNPDDYSNALGYLGAYKKEISFAKVPTTVDYTAQICQQGEPVLLFTWFTEVNDKLAAGLRKKKLRVAQIHSKMNLSSAEKDKIVADFQAGKIDVLVAGIKIAGVGLTLTRASNVVYNDLSWVAGDLEQSEDRIHRIGQEKSCSISYMVMQDQFDEMLWTLVNNKYFDVNAVMDGVAPGKFATGEKSVIQELSSLWQPKKQP